MNDVPDKLRPYTFHGVGLSISKREATGQCPFCERNKFSVNTETGKWKCWSASCAESGNIFTFLRKFHAFCTNATSLNDYQELANDRGFLDSQVLAEWQICRSVLNGNWLIPGYNIKGDLTSLYRYVPQKQGGFRLLPTPTLGHHLHGMNLWNQKHSTVYICEGPWDAIAFWEVLTKAKITNEGYKSTASYEASLARDANVIAVPGCEVFFEGWLPLFKDKIVCLMYDSDHPRKNPSTGKMNEPAGWRAMRRVAGMLAESKFQPEEIKCIHWNGETGYDPKRKSGFDIRDFLCQGV